MRLKAFVWQIPITVNRTVTLALKNKGINVSHKAVLRIMRENNFLCQAFKI
ncbi:IS3 family transposase [Lactiplantibacillus plantarum]|uniref:IS3 family transposase n=1 Tax=Lactiplantibacillus plantarum TaxID=1590 RepID=UPI000A461905